MADSLDESGQTLQQKAAERGDGQPLPSSSESEPLQRYPSEVQEYMTNSRSEQTLKTRDGSLQHADGFQPRALSVPDTETPPLVHAGLLVEDHKRDGEETLLQETKRQLLQREEALRQAEHPTHQKQLPPLLFGEPQPHSMPQHEPLVFAPFPSTNAPQPEIPQLNEELLLQKEQSDFSDSAMGDGQSLASRTSTEPEGQALAGRAQPFEGGPPISFTESADALLQAEHGVEIGGDSEMDDGYETDSSATSQSLVASARQFIFENGRRYHSYRADTRPYLFPNDDREQDREDLKHAMFLKLFNKTLHFAPVPVNGANVLDLGTGTGIWAVDFADLYPSASVLGIDLSPIQTVWVPPNLKFMVDDAESEWLHPPNNFDLIHTRHTIQAFRNWPLIFERAFTHLRPGGWIECQELDHVPQCEDSTMTPDNPMLSYWLNVSAGLKTLGVDFRLAPQLANLMRAAGFINVTERIFFTPIGPWPRNRALKEVGMYWRAVLMEGIEAIALGPFMRGLGWGREEVEVFIAGVRKAYVEKGVHAFMPFYIVYGQKPHETSAY